jgi:hypothetical protein
LKPFNTFVTKRHFRLESLPPAGAGDFKVKIDIKDAYLHIPIAPEHWALFQLRRASSPVSLSLFRRRTLRFRIIAPTLFPTLLRRPLRRQTSKMRAA